MSAAGAALPQRAHRGELRLGDRVSWQGRVHLVVALAGTSVTLLEESEGAPPQTGAPVPAGDLAPTPGTTVLWLDYLVNSPGFEIIGRSTPELSLPPLARLEAVNPEAVARARAWEPHIIEVHTGVHPDAPDGSAPRPEYDPRKHTLADRYRAKAVELSAAGWRGASAATVERKRGEWLKDGLWGLVDGRRTQVPTELGRADARVVQMLLRLVERMRKREGSVGTASRLRERLRQALERTFGVAQGKELLPPKSSFYKLLKRLGIRVKDLTAPLRRQSDQANRPLPPFTPTRAQLPGERVEIDTTGLDLLALGEDGRPVALELTVAIDVATRSIMAAVIRPKHSGVKGQGGKRRRGGRATKGIDASLLLAQMLIPQAARRHWSPLAQAENSDLPHAQLVEADPSMAGASARPVITPSMIVVDHGKVFTSQTFTDACTYLGITVRPARTRTPTDKAIIERTFSSVKSLFCQHVGGYTGSDLSRRGKGVEKGRLWRLDEINDLLQQWICLGWQQRPHEGLRNPFHPQMPALTPNQAYAAHVAAAGHLPVPLGPKDVLHLLPTTWARITDTGIRFNGRTYDGAQLNPYRGAPSGLWGRKRTRWEVRYHPYQPETVWLHDHRTDEWITVDFIHKDLLTDQWTEYLWEQATADFLERGGRRDDEEGITRALSKLLRLAGRPPARDAQQPVTREESVRVPAPDPVDPYANIPPVDPTALTARRTLDGEPAALYGGTTPAPEAPPTMQPAAAPPGQRRHGVPAPAPARTLSGAAATLLAGLAARTGLPPGPHPPATDTAPAVTRPSPTREEP